MASKRRRNNKTTNGNPLIIGVIIAILFLYVETSSSSTTYFLSEQVMHDAAHFDNTNGQPSHTCSNGGDEDGDGLIDTAVFGGGDDECYFNVVNMTNAPPVGWTILPSEYVNTSTLNSDMFYAMPQHEAGCLTRVSSSPVDYFILAPACDSNQDGELDIIFYSPEWFTLLNSINDPVPTDVPALGCTYLGDDSNGDPVILSAYNVLPRDCYTGIYSHLGNSGGNSNSQGGQGGR